MKYPKQALDFADQADLLLKRGLVADRNELINCLGSVSYYRLSAYWYTFRKQGSDNLIEGTSLDIVWKRYVFDRQLRLLIMDAIERVEIALRTQLVNCHSLKYGPFGYLDRNNLPGMTVDQHRTFLEKIRTEAEQSKEDFVVHYFGKYTSETDLPLWMASELMTFGMMLTLFRHIEKPIKYYIAAQYGVADVVLESWLLSLNFIRNICAHHSRLWNRGLGNKQPSIPRVHKHPEWHMPVAVPSNSVFGILTVLYYLLKQVTPRSHWKNRLEKLLADYSDIPLRFMGFPENWKDCPIWQDKDQSA